jgi:predicted DNA-binding protein
MEIDSRNDPKICVIIPKEMKEELDRICKNEERNISWVVRNAIQEYIEWYNDR